MGKFLDALFASAFTFLVVLFALSFTGRDSRVCAAIALVAAYCAGAAMQTLLKRKPRLSFRKRRLLADKRVKALVYADAAKAHEEVFALLRARYPISGESYESGRMRFTHMNSEKSALCVVQKLRVSPDDVLATWRAYGRGGDVRAIVVALPGKSEQDARVAALRLSRPGVVIIDRRQLRGLMRKYGRLEAPGEQPRKLRLLPALSALITRRRAWRYLLYACLLNAYYLITGQAAYLAASLLLLCVAALSMKKREEPEQLI